MPVLSSAARGSTSPTTLAPQHFQEWLNSGISTELIDYLAAGGYLYTIEGNREIDQLLNRNTRSRWKHGPSSCAWVLHGVDPLSNYDRCGWFRLKPDDPRIDLKKGKPVKYESPIGEPTRAVFLPNLWWDWSDVLADKTLTIALCEGEKKAASLISHGYYAVSIPGIFSGYRTDEQTGVQSLIPDLQLLAGHPIKFCFDFETKPETLKNVNLAIHRTGSLLEQAGGGGQLRWGGRVGRGDQFAGSPKRGR